jgi:hypothetical protein
MKRLIGALLAVWIAVIMGLGCSPTADPDGGGGTKLDRKTPDHLLEWLATAYEEKGGEAYDEALHDKFLFVFTDEVAHDMGLPADQPWWGKTQDVNSTRKMFADPRVKDIKMDYVTVGNWEAITDSVGGEEYSCLFSRVTPDIEVTIDESGTEPTTYVVRESWLDISVVMDTTSVPGETLFQLLKIEEIPFPH